jgi:hypothetical protein
MTIVDAVISLLKEGHEDFELVDQGSIDKYLDLMILVGNVGDMSATCRADMSMSANFPDIPFFCRHPFLPIWQFPRIICWEMPTFP